VRTQTTTTYPVLQVGHCSHRRRLAHIVGNRRFFDDTVGTSITLWVPRLHRRHFVYNVWRWTTPEHNVFLYLQPHTV